MCRTEREERVAKLGVDGKLKRRKVHVRAKKALCEGTQQKVREVKVTPEHPASRARRTNK